MVRIFLAGGAPSTEAMGTIAAELVERLTDALDDGREP